MATALFTPALAAPTCYNENSASEYYYGGAAAAAAHHGHASHHHAVPRHSASASAPVAMMDPNSLPPAPTPPVLSISPPIHKKPGAAGAPAAGAVNASHGHGHGRGQAQLGPHIHSSSMIETFRKILGDLRTDDPDDFFAGEENAFLVCDLANVYAKFQLWERELGGLVEPFFAIKCNPDPLVVKMMIKLGAGFDCASHQEISQVVAAGLTDPKEIEERIIYANPCKANSFIKFASKAHVRLMTFDNVDELYKVKKYHPHAQMVLRILTDDSGSLCKLGLKFGSPLSEVRKLLTKAKELGIEVVGVSFHVGSGCTNPMLFADAVERAAWAFGVGAELGYNFDLLDIGGGFGGENFVQIARIVRPVLERLFPKETSGVRIIAEPGRYFVADAFEMATNIIARRGKRGDEDVEEEEVDEIDLHSDDDAAAAAAAAESNEVVQQRRQEMDGEEDAEENVVMYYVNDGVYGAFNCTMFDHQIVHPVVLTQAGQFVSSPPPLSVSARNEPFDPAYKACSIWGPTCDSIDCVSALSYLPNARLRIGDWLRWQNMGAYTICAASQFNGFKKSTVHYTIDAKGDRAVETTIRKLLA